MTHPLTVDSAAYSCVALIHWFAGGDVNLTDDDGDTPLYTVEDTETARFLVEHGAALDHRNAEGVSVCLPLLPSSPFPCHNYRNMIAHRTPGGGVSACSNLPQNFTPRAS